MVVLNLFPVPCYSAAAELCWAVSCLPNNAYISWSLLRLQLLYLLKIGLFIIFFRTAVAGVWPGRFCIVCLR